MLFLLVVCCMDVLVGTEKDLLIKNYFLFFVCEQVGFHS